MASSIAFDFIARDRASATFKKVGDAADKTRGQFDRLGETGGGLGARLSRGFKRINAEREGKQIATRFGVGFHGAFGGVVSRSAGIFAAGFAAIKGAQVFGGFINDARESAKIGRITAQVIKSTGGAAKVSAQQVGALSTAISNKTGVDDEAIQSGENLLLTFTNIRNATGKNNDIFNQATQIMTDMSVALGQDTKSSAIQLGKALNDPVKGVTALQRVGVSFDATQKKQIEGFVKAGKTAEAQKVILRELGKEFGGAAAAASDPMARLQVVLGNVGEAIGGVLLPYVDKAASFITDRLIPGAQALFDLFVRGNFSAAFRQAFGVEEDAPIVGTLFRIRDAAIGLFQLFVHGNFTAAFRQAFNVEEDAPIVGVLFRVRDAAIKAFGWLRDNAKPILLGLVVAMGLMAAPVTTVAAGLALLYARSTTFRDIVAAVAGFITGRVIPAFQAFGGFITGTIWPALQRVGGFLADTFRPTFQALSDVISQKVVPGLQGLWAIIQRNAPAFAAIGKAIGVVVGVVGFLVAKLAGFLLPILVKVAGFLITVLFQAIGNVISKIGALVRAVQTGWQYFQTFVGVVSAVWSTVQSVIRQAVGKIAGWLGGITSKVGGLLEAFGMKDLGGKLKNAGKAISDFAAGVNQDLGGIKNRTVTVGVDLSTGMATSPGGGRVMVGGPSNGGTRIPRADGGLIRGPGTATSDSIAARLSNGEYVVKARSVEKYGPAMLDAINAGRFAGGGLVGVSAVTPSERRVADVSEAIANGVDRIAQRLATAAARRMAGPGGPLGTGAVMGWRRQWAAVHGAFPWAHLTSAFRPGARTVSGNRSYHALGRAIDVTPSMAIFNWIRATYGARTKELIFSPAGGAQLKNGRPHYYTGAVRAMHFNHVHWAMANGGVIPEPVLGVGRSGRTYSFGESGPETVIPGRVDSSGGSVVVQFVLDGRVVQQSLLRLKRGNGGLQLGLA